MAFMSQSTSNLLGALHECGYEQLFCYQIHTESDNFLEPTSTDAAIPTTRLRKTGVLLQTSLQGIGHPFNPGLP
jgi:hypothetical protein